MNADGDNDNTDGDDDDKHHYQNYDHIDYITTASLNIILKKFSFQ